MEVDPVFVPFQRAVSSALVDRKRQARGTKARPLTSEKLSQYRQFSSAGAAGGGRGWQCVQRAGHGRNSAMLQPADQSTRGGRTGAGVGECMLRPVEPCGLECWLGEEASREALHFYPPSVGNRGGGRGGAGPGVYRLRSNGVPAGAPGRVCHLVVAA